MDKIRYIGSARIPPDMGEKLELLHADIVELKVAVAELRTQMRVATAIVSAIVSAAVAIAAAFIGG